MPPWLERQFRNTDNDLATWPNWKRKEVGLMNLPPQSPPATPCIHIPESEYKRLLQDSWMLCHIFDHYTIRDDDDREVFPEDILAIHDLAEKEGSL